MAQADNLSLPEGLSIGLSMEGDGSTGLPTQFVKSMRTLFDMMDDSNSGKVALAEIERRWRDDAVPNLPGVLDALRTVAPANGLLTFEHFVSGLKLALHRVRSKNQPRRNVTANQQFGFQQISTNVQSMTWNGTHITDPNSCNTRSYLPAPPGHKVTANKRGSAYVRSNSSTNVDSDFSRRRARFKHRRSNSGPIVLGKSLSNMDQPSPLHGTMAFDDSVVEENRLQRMPRERDLHLGIGLSQKLPSCIPGRYEFSHRDRRNVKVLSDATNIGVRGSPSGCDSSSPDSAFYSPCQERSPSLHRNCCGGDPVSSKALLNDRISDDDGNTHVISVQPVVLSGKYIGITGTLKRTKSPAAIAQKRYGSLPRPTSKAMTNGGYSYSQLTENVATEEMHADQRMKSKDADSHPRKRSVPQRSESSLRSCVDYTHSERRTNVSPQAVPAEKSARKLAPALSIPRESKEPSKMRSFFSGDLNADTRRRKVSGSYHPSRRRNQRRNTTSISFDTSTMKQLTNIQQKEDLLRKGLATTEGIKKAILHALMQVENERSHLEAEMEAFTAGTRGFPNQPELQENSAVSPSVMTAMGSLEHIINDFLLLEMSTKHVTPNSSATVDSLADVQDENLRLSREVSEKSDVIRQLEEEKTALVRQLFQARSELQQREETSYKSMKCDTVYEIPSGGPVSTQENSTIKTMHESGRMTIKVVVGSCLVIVVLIVIPIALYFHQQAECNKDTPTTEPEFSGMDESTTAMEFSGMESTTALLTTEGSKNETTFGTTDVTTTFYSTAESGITNETMVNPTTLLTTTENEAAFETTTIFEAIGTTTSVVAPPCEETCENECKAHRTCSCRSDICTEVGPVCGENSACVSLQCQCLSGYNFTYAEEVNCTDINECDNDVCPGKGRTCTNSPGSFQCVCEEGYVPNPTAPGCVENTCSSSDCGSNSGCFDSSTECQCFVGYSENPENECFDVDECTSLPQTCLVTEICINTDGSYYCDCISGYTKSDGDVCMPIRCGVEPVQCNATSSLLELCQSARNLFTEITFPSTLAGYYALSDNLCGDGTPNAGIPLGSRDCVLDGTWEKTIWLSSCGDGLSTVASQPIESEEDRLQVSVSLEILTSNPQTVDSEDVTSTTEAIANVTTSAANISAAMATSVICTISNVMESPGLDASGQSQELLNQLDLVASKVSLGNGELYQAVCNNVSILVTQSQNTMEGIGMVMFVRPNTSSNGFRSDQFSIYNSPVTSGGRIAGQQVQSSIHIPAKALENSTKASFYVFGNANLFTVNSNSRSSGTANDASDVSSMVISATVENRSISDLPPDSLLTYSMPILYVYDDTKDEPTCVFWSEVSGKWSEEGCNVNKSASDNETLSCSCDHLTNFAALLRPIPENQKALDVITIVGCTISTFSLLILVMIFLFVPKTRAGRKFQAAFLLLNLSLALLGLNIKLLISEMPFISNPEHYDSIASSCIAIAIILHFFLLASCAWMNCEGAMLCLAVIKPFYTRAHLQNNKVVMGSVSWGWAMPAIFVGIVALSDINVYKYPYEVELVVTCWIEKNSLYIAVIPTAIIIGANLVVYVILSYYLCRNRQGGWGKSWKSTRESQKRKLGVNVSILILLGMTWVFGFFLAGIENETTTLVFAYIFTILNSLQGFFLLVLYVLRNKETCTTVRKVISSMYDKLGLSSSRSKESGGGRRFSTGFTDIQSNPYRQTLDNTVDIDASETAGEVSLNSTIRRRSQNDYASEVEINWRTISDENAL